MKKLIFLLLFLLISFHWVDAQNYDDKFHLRMNLGLSHPTDNNFGAIGFANELELQFFQKGFISMGAKTEMEAIVSKSLNLIERRVGVSSTRLLFAVLPVFDIHFLKGNIQPFIGGGYGWYSMPAIDVVYMDGDLLSGDLHLIRGTERKQNWTWMCRAGVDINSFRVALEYNPVGENDGRSYKYITLKVGLRLF